MQTREEKIDDSQSGLDSFARRHIGPNETEIAPMLRDIGSGSAG
jgi:hypothetical protein